MARLDEFKLIQKLTDRKQSRSFQQKRGVIVGVGDDAAVAHITAQAQLVMSCDTMVEGIHFNRWTMEDEDIGFKALAANISDMAAMGAIPKYALVSISVPKRVSDYRLKRIYSGLYECAEIYGVAVVGGDTTSAPHDFSLSVTIIGEVEAGKALLRSKAVHDDCVFITGLIGRSAVGLDYLMQCKQPNLRLCDIPEPMRAIVLAHRRPKPSVEAGRILLRSGLCHALNDISDGLASEAWEIAEASNVGIVLDETSIPVPADLRGYAMKRNKSPLDWMLYGGEDYVLIGTLPSHDMPRVQRAFAAAQIDLYMIGKVTHNFKGVQLIDKEGNVEQVSKKGYQHF